MKIKTYNLMAQFVNVGQEFDFQIDRDIVGKCKVIGLNKETNEIEFELDKDSSVHFETFEKEILKHASFSIDE